VSVEFTPEQLRAIESRDGPLFLHAAAGSGKTSVLVERFVRAVLEDGVALDRILAITFTEKAAAELKLRIRKRLLELGEREQAREAEGAWISTIHGFCSRLLRTHPLAAGIDPEYRVLDEPEADRIGLDAFERALEKFLEEGTEDGSTRLELLASYTPQKLDQMVRTVHSRLRSRGERRPALPALPPRPPSDADPAEFESALVAALAELDASGADGPTVERELHRMRRCSEALRALAGRLADPSDAEGWGVRPGNAGALRTQAFERLADAHRVYYAACVQEREERDYGLLRELLELYGARYERLKEERSALDFEDLQLIARDLLEVQPGLREHYRQRFDHLMVDEFQDTNRLQASILALLERGNLFTVGDVHQSIYLFRNADVGVFREHQEAAEGDGRDARLSDNFRSRRELLDALNLSFGSVFDPGFEPLREPAGDRRDAPPASPSVELLVVDSKRWGDAFPDGEQPFGPTHAPPWRAAEARLLAHRLAALAGLDGPFEPGDVAVLVRAATDIAVYERAIADQGLPTYVAGGRGYWSQQQVGDLRAYLAALANPLDELALHSLLASPLVGASIDALGLIGLRAHALDRDVWWTLEEAFLPSGDGSRDLADALTGGDRERVAAFVERFAAEREAGPRLSLERLIDRAVTGSGYDRAVLRMPAGERRLANVRKLMRLAREYEADEGRDLRGFIDFVGEQDMLRAREGEAPLETEGIDAVRLMTIHAAKGLEFPLVCVADLGRLPRGDDDALRVTEDGRVGLSVASLGGGRAAGMELEEIKEEQAALADQEERRIFYVAMTRAREHLILSGATDIEQWPEWRRTGPPLDWIWRALAPDLPDLESSGESLRVTPDGREARVRCVTCSAHDLDSALPREHWTPGPQAAAGNGRAAAAVQPPLLAAVEAAGAPPVGRLSYSSLESYRRCGYRFYLERVAGLRRATAELADAAGEPVAGGVGALLRGTVVHELLERFDFARRALPDPRDVEELLDARGASYGEPDVDGIRSLIEGFAGSELCRRLAHAERLRRELPFAFTLRPHGASGASLLVNGVVDVHARERGSESTLIVDYKSDPVEGLDLVAVCEEKYGTQRLIYALAALRSGAPEVEVVHCFLERPAEPVSAHYGAAEAAALEAQLLGLAGGVLGGRFEPTDRPHRELCALCPGRPALCSWDEEHTLAELNPPV
jgi:ATP-dependent helicase/nuclease subunit A